MAWAYFDTSALIKRYVDENGRREVLQLLRSHDCVTSALLSVELRSAVRRRVGDGSLDERRVPEILKRFAVDREFWALVGTASEVLQTAETLVSKYPLRTLDAIHVASAQLFAARMTTSELIFVSADARQTAVAAAIGIPTQDILGQSSPIEVWYSEDPVKRGRFGPVEWAARGSVLFGSLASRLEGELAAETEGHFAVLLTAIEARGYPHLLRVWNFLPEINAEEGGTERYRLFNCGRAAAFDARYGVTEAEARFSASSAVGSVGDHLVTFFAAARSPRRMRSRPGMICRA